MIAERDFKMFHRTMRATFLPKRTDDLREEIRSLIGETVEWECADYGSEGEPYEGQYRWYTSDPRWEGHWVPDEDLQPC